ncbi:MAG: vWA domain-containing protein [Prosthecobacter sp.]
MRFIAPQFLHLAWLAFIPLALWLYRRHAKRLPVSTLLFFKSLAREHQESAWVRRVKKWLSLAFTLLIVLLAVLALARPTHESAAHTPKAVVLVIDCSASMAAMDSSGKTRLMQAATELQQIVRSLPDQAVISLITFDTKTEVVLSRSRNRRECLRLLSEIKPLPIAGDATEALATAHRLAELDVGATLWLASDTKADGDIRFIDCGLPEVVNVGITGFQIRPSPLSGGQHEVFVKVSAASANRAKVTSMLEVSLAGRPVQIREIELEPGGSSTLILPVESARGQRLELQLKTPGDNLGWDDALTAPLPRNQPLSVAWITDKPDPFTQIALASLIESHRIEIARYTSDAWPPKEKPDVYVFEHWLPKTWPIDRPVIVLNPTSSCGPISVKALPGNGLPHDNLRSVLPDHPVLFRVASSRVAVTQTSVLALPASIEPLWIAGTEPVLAAGEHTGQRIVVSAFSPATSEQLALLPAFPLVLGNALYWCAESNEALASRRSMRTGQLVPASGLVNWHAWNGLQFTDFSTQTTSELLPLTHIGIWETADGKTGASVLASTTETHVPRRSAEATTTVEMRKGAMIASDFFSTWPQKLLWLLLALLLVESFLFHRKAVY